MIQGFSSGLIGNRELIYETDLPSFQRDFASLKTLDHGYGPAITFTRASGATFFDANGVLQTAANNAPRFDHDPVTGASRGLLIEEARTNSIRNSQAGGAVAGVSGTLPTNWTGAVASGHGITREVVGTGTENGMDYVDIKYSGTPTANGDIYPTPEIGNQVAASSGQTWTFSSYYKLAAGSLSNVTVRIFVSERGSTGSDLAHTTATVTPTTASLASQRASVTRTFNNASTNFALGFFGISYTNGNPIDLTLRIAAPQLEQGAFPTSYIPTTTAAATRAADSAVVTPISSFYNQSEGTLFADFRTGQDLVSTRGLMFDNGSNNQNALTILGSTSGGSGNAFEIRAANASVATLPTFTTTVANTNYRIAGAYKSADHAGSLNGAYAATSSAVGMPTGITHLNIGSSDNGAGSFLNGHIRKIAYWPRRLSNTLLQQLTT